MEIGAEAIVMKLLNSLVFFFGLSVLAFAGAPGTDTKATDDDLRIRGIFDSALPGTEGKRSLRLIVHPHFGDLHQRDFLRVPVGLRYGLNDRLEVTGEVETFFGHGFGKSGFFDQEGFSNVHVGAKIQLGDLRHSGWETALGFDWTLPVGKPPTEITDGLQHVSPFITFSRRLPDAELWRVFWAVGYDDVQTTSVPGQIRRNELGQDAVNLSGGFLRQRGSVTYTLEAAWTSAHLMRNLGRDVFTFRPAAIWVVPERYTFGSKGKWLLGAGLRFSHGPDGFDTGVNAKLRVNFDFKRLWRSPKKSGP